MILYDNRHENLLVLVGCLNLEIMEAGRGKETLFYGITAQTLLVGLGWMVVTLGALDYTIQRVVCHLIAK